MEGRINKYRQVSPERAKVWTEKSPRYHYNHNYNQQHHDVRKVPVVYYLCRNQQLDHPHFMEVPLSSSDDRLYLRDVIERLNVLRGRGIASMYSWSCKRNYKHGYVWHDLCDDDIVHTAHGNDYILKGTELFEESTPGQYNPTRTSITQTEKLLPKPPNPRKKERSPSPSSSNSRAMKGARDDDDISPLLCRPCSSAVSPEPIVVKKSSFNSPSNLEDIGRRSTCTRGVLTEGGLSEPNEDKDSQDKDEVTAAAAPPLSIGTDTLESLVRADIRKILEEEGCRAPSRTKLKFANTIMQLVTCGSISVKDHKFPLMLGEGKSSCSIGLRLNDNYNFRGSSAETSMPKERSSFHADSCRSDKENVIKMEESLLQELGL